MLDVIEKNLLKEVAELDSLPVGAYNIRANGELAGRNTTANIDIVTKTDKPGIDIYIRPFTKNESVHIPVILSQTGLKDLVYNDFHIGEGADVTIIAGCGIHNCGGGNAQHDGIHTFYLAKNARLRYVEKHYGEGDGRGKQIMNPTTIVHLAEGAQMEMETTQIAGVDDTIRKTSGDLAAGASLVIREKIMTTGDQHAVTDFDVDLNGEGCSANVVSRSVAKDVSRQEFVSHINGNCACAGHSECDAIIMDNASVIASPALTANSVDASLIHEAAIGKIAGEQLIKLMTLGLTEKEAEDQIVKRLPEITSHGKAAAAFPLRRLFLPVSCFSACIMARRRVPVPPAFPPPPGPGRPPRFRRQGGPRRRCRGGAAGRPPLPAPRRRGWQTAARPRSYPARRRGRRPPRWRTAPTAARCPPTAPAPWG